MAQIKIYGFESNLHGRTRAISDVIHSCVMDALAYPADKRFHRFFPLCNDTFFIPPDRSERYTIIEISMFEGRSTEAKSALIRLLFERAQQRLAISPVDLEITIFETPRRNWGIRGVTGDTLALTYTVDV